ncbi:MAG: hypothetical protein WBX17_05925, partial [Microbacterium sp.]
MASSDDDSFAEEDAAWADAEPVDDAEWYVDRLEDEGPDDVDRVTEVADMMAVFAAQRLVRVEAMRRNALADAARYGGAVQAVVERSLRLELAAALRVT